MHDNLAVLPHAAKGPGPFLCTTLRREWPLAGEANAKTFLPTGHAKTVSLFYVGFVGVFGTRARDTGATGRVVGEWEGG